VISQPDNYAKNQTRSALSAHCIPFLSQPQCREERAKRLNCVRRNNNNNRIINCLGFFVPRQCLRWKRAQIIPPNAPAAASCARMSAGKKFSESRAEPLARTGADRPMFSPAAPEAATLGVCRRESCSLRNSWEHAAHPTCQQHCND